MSTLTLLRANFLTPIQLVAVVVFYFTKGLKHNCFYVDDNASSSTFLPEVPSTTRRQSVPPSTGLLHQKTTEISS